MRMEPSTRSMEGEVGRFTVFSLAALELPEYNTETHRTTLTAQQPHRMFLSMQADTDRWFCCFFSMNCITWRTQTQTHAFYMNSVCSVCCLSCHKTIWFSSRGGQELLANAPFKPDWLNQLLVVLVCSVPMDEHTTITGLLLQRRFFLEVYSRDNDILRKCRSHWMSQCVFHVCEFTCDWVRTPRGTQIHLTQYLCLPINVRVYYRPDPVISRWLKCRLERRV